MVAEADRRAAQAQDLAATATEAERKLEGIAADRKQVEILFRVQKNSEEWLTAEIEKLDKSELKPGASFTEHRRPKPPSRLRRHTTRWWPSLRQSVMTRAM